MGRLIGSVASLRVMSMFLCVMDVFEILMKVKTKFVQLMLY